MKYLILTPIESLPNNQSVNYLVIEKMISDPSQHIGYWNIKPCDDTICIFKIKSKQNEN